MRITINDDVLNARVAKLAAVHQAAHDAAEKIAETARGTAPEVSGDYKNGIIVQDFGSPSSRKAGARVLASDFKSAWIEFGVPERGIPATFNLRNAVDSAGFKFKSHG